MPIIPKNSMLEKPSKNGHAKKKRSQSEIRKHESAVRRLGSRLNKLTEEKFDEYLVHLGHKVDHDMGQELPPEKPNEEGLKKLARFVGRVMVGSDPAIAMARDKNLMDRIVDDCHALGLVGECNLIKSLYIVGTSRLCPRPLSAIVQGPSSSGKSIAVDKIYPLFPPEDVLNATRMTPQALYHYGSLAHKFVIGGERSHRNDDDGADATAALRQLKSEGKISKLMPEKVDGKFTSKLYEVRGPIAYVETTTLKPDRIFGEDLNRDLLLKTDESEKHTKDILEKSASRYMSDTQPIDTAAIIEKHREFQNILNTCPVVIPFAKELVKDIPAKQVKARRVANQILCVIEVVTLLHQFQREKDSRGRLVATVGDYEIAKSILVQPLGESLGIPASPAKFYGLLKAKFSGRKFSTADAKKADLKTSDSAVVKWLRALAEHGCIKLIKKTKGREPAIWILNSKTPEQTVLPDSSKLERE